MTNFSKPGTRTFVLGLLTTGALAACGGTDSAFEPGAGNDTGAGTGTLRIEGSISADSNRPNAELAADFTTEFRIRIQLNGVNVTTGEVTVTSASGTYPLTYDTQNNNDWVGSAPGYDEVYGLDVVSGADEVTGVRVDGPDIHTFAAPLMGATVDSAVALDLAWDRRQAADTASLDVPELDTIAITDTGTYALSAGALKASRDQAETNELRLRRANRVIPTGAVTGSEVSVSVRNEIDVVAQPNPAL